MNWLNLETKTLRTAEFIGAEPTERATWLCILAYCCEHENQGRLSNCRNWKSRQWQQLCGVTIEEVYAECDLWEWQGDDLVVSFYPIDKEAEVKGKRDSARANGRKGGRPKKTNGGNPEKPTLVPTSETQKNQRCKAERKGKEGEGKEKGKNIPPKSPTGDLVVLEVCESPKPDPIKTRVGKLFGRRESTKWSSKETAAYKAARIVEDDLCLVERWFAAPEDPDRPLWRRTALQTLLNNWSGEVDKARMWGEKNQPKRETRKTGAIR